MKKERKELGFCIAVCLVSIAFMLFMPNVTSPVGWNEYRYGFDSSIFMYVGKSMKYGYIPYRDLYDIKGPVLWVFQWLGQSICEGKVGIFIVETFVFSAINLLTYKTSRLYLSQIRTMILLLIMQLFWLVLGEEGNIVEKYSTLFSMIAVYITVRNIKNNQSNSIWQMMIIGGCALSAMFIRLTDCVIVGACIIYYVVYNIKNKDIRQMLYGLTFCLLGVITAALPFIIYYWVNDALYSMIDAIVLFSVRYSGFNKSWRNIIFMGYLIIPFITAIGSIVRKRSNMGLLLIIMSAMCLLLHMKVGVAYRHYTAIGIPSLILAGIMIFNFNWIKLGKRKIRVIIISLLIVSVGFVFLISGKIYRYSIGILESSEIESDMVFSEAIAGIIDNNTDRVYNYSNVKMFPYLSDLHSKSKYFQSQIHWSGNPEKKEEIYNDFIQGNNYWILTDKSLKSGDERIIWEIENKYEIVYSYDQYNLYKLKE